MKRRSIAQIILINFFKTIGIIVLLIGVGVLSYYLTMLFLKQTQRIERSTQYEHVIEVNPGSMESSNLIYSYNKKSGRIEAMVLELFDASTKNMTYVTIPADTQIMISAKSYGELLEKSPMLPQMVTMSDIKSYFSGDVAFEYGIMILKEELKADIGYFTALSSDVFARCFEREEGKKLIYRPADKLLKEAGECKSEDDMKDFIESRWDNLISDITLSQKQHYAKELTGVRRELIRTYRLYGTESGGVFKLNKDRNKKFIEKIWERKAYNTEQKKRINSSESSAKSTDSIWVYNGSKIAGLAAGYKKKLEAAGFSVKGVGNAPEGEARYTTEIYVKKKKMAKELQKYFKNPKIIVADNLKSGADIEIVLGTQDDL